MTEVKTSVSLVLGSGGARGLAHIGVIRWLEQNGYRIDSIAGSSIGALVGGVHAMGKTDEFVNWVTAIGRTDMFRLMDFTLDAAGLVKGEKIIEALRQLTGEMLIEDLPVPFTAVAADIDSEREVWISRGPLYDAIRASISIPLLFEPVKYKGMYLLDGGVLNPVPIAPTFRDHTDLTIAVSLSGPANPDISLPPRQEQSESEESFFSRKIGQFVDSLFNASMSTQRESKYRVALQAIDTMEGAIARQKLAAYPPDHVVNIPQNLCSIIEFDRARDIIHAGYRLAGQQLRPAG